MHHRAQNLHEAGEHIAAHALASKGLAAHPGSIGANRCYNLIQQIEAPSASATVDRVWNHEDDEINLTYRNVTRVYFRLIPFDFERFANSNRYAPEGLSQDERRALLKREFTNSWSETLPPTDDYKERHAELPVPQDVKPGSYYLLTSHNPEFVDQKNQISL